MSVNKKEPMPKKNKRVCVQDEVTKDLKERKSIGIKKYGTVLQPFNGRDSSVDAYQEILDLAVYHKQMIIEFKEIKNTLKEISKELSPLGNFLVAAKESREKIEKLLEQLGEHINEEV